MGLLDPTKPPYDPLEWSRKPFTERARMVCETWAMQGYGTPLGVYGVYAIKVLLYIGGWALFCTFTPGYEFGSIGKWWLAPIAFQKAILWSMLFEGLGLGCGSGPLTGRYMPPVGGFLYFLRPGTTKLPLFERAPIIGGMKRTVLDVALYAGLLVALLAALVAPAITLNHLLPIVVIAPLLGICDRTIFLALRGEHYWVTAVCFLFAAPDWIAGSKAVQCALWFWAGFSKLNHHFPAVVCVMTSNSPMTRIPGLRRLMYKSYPDDLRPSNLAVAMSHAGTALEMSVPLVLLFAPGGWSLKLGIVLMLLLHTHITSSVPMGVPIEWNFMVVYGAFALFWAHPDVSVFNMQSPVLALFLAVMVIAIPLIGNVYPGAVSFLMAMRYYAGNWAYGVWLFRGESYRKLDKLKKTSPWVYDQLHTMYDHRTAVGLFGRVMAFRLMHLHGRALPFLIPKAVDRLENYEWVDGEVVAGLVLGWNFGDGHLHREQLLRAVQAQCGFNEGELRCIFVESQPLGRSTMSYRIHDAKTGLMEEGEVDVRELRTRQPWAAV